jgi:dTDP-glucose 4,6-dehydratase
VTGLVLLSESDERYPVNLGNPTELTILEFANQIRARFDNAVGIDYKPLPADDPKLRRPDIKKAKRVLGWEPKVSLEDGLTETIDYFKKKVKGEALNGIGPIRKPVVRTNQPGV